jgi:hypothetical protein
VSQSQERPGRRRHPVRWSENQAAARRPRRYSPGAGGTPIRRRLSAVAVAIQPFRALG